MLDFPRDYRRLNKGIYCCLYDVCQAKNISLLAALWNLYISKKKVTHTNCITMTARHLIKLKWCLIRLMEKIAMLCYVLCNLFKCWYNWINITGKACHLMRQFIYFWLNFFFLFLAETAKILQNQAKLNQIKQDLNYSLIILKPHLSNPIKLNHH